MTEDIFYIQSPIGTLQISMQCGCVCAISVQESARASSVLTAAQKAVKREIDEYFSGKRKEFAFPLKINGTLFQKRVWSELRNIPYGCVTTYGEVAARIGAPNAARAVGMACNRNPLLLVVPCHRVVGVGGVLTGFASGVERKEFLLKLEQPISVI